MILLTFFQHTSIFLLAFILFLVLIVAYAAGVQVRKRVKAKLLDSSMETSNVSSTLLGLLALLLAFSFGMANSRYDQRRKLVIDEVNALKTAVLRADIYPDTVRDTLRAEFKKYVEARIAYYKQGVERDQIEEYFNNASLIGESVWKIAADYARISTETEEAAQLLPAINSMLEIATSRLALHQGRVPESILHFLFILSVSSTFLLGFESKRDPEWIPIIGFTLMLALTVFSVIDLDRPRSGFINLDEENAKIVDILNLLDRKMKH